MGVSDKIEAFITELMKDEEDYAEFGRNELASIFNCVPSQINYVIRTRFGPERGYSVESRRGGGGYIKIRKVDLALSGDAIAGLSMGCTQNKAEEILNCLCAQGKISHRQGELIRAMISDKALANAKENKNVVRADMLKNLIVNL